MTAGNYVIIERLDQPAAAGENGYCGFTYFLESSCCCVIVGCPGTHKYLIKC